MPGTPTVTTDHEQAKADLDEWGYCLIGGALAPERLAALRARVVEVGDAEVEDGTAWLDTGGSNQRIFNLQNKGSLFTDLVQDPLAMEFMGHLLCSPAEQDGGPMGLGREFLLSSVLANVAGPGAAAQGLHADQLYVPTPWTYSVVANIMWMLDDFTEEIGATRVVPGSHKLGRGPDYSKGVPESIPAEAPAGTALVFDGRLWHGTGANTTADRRRYGILTYYCRPYIRQQQNFFLNLDPAVLADATPTLRRLLGYESYAGLGAVNGLPDEYRQPGLRPTWLQPAG